MSSPSLYHQNDTRIQSELQIIEKSKTNPNYFSPLYNQYHESIFRYILKRVDDKESAYDITSNVFVKALTNLHRYEFRGVPFSSWLFRWASLFLSLSLFEYLYDLTCFRLACWIQAINHPQHVNVRSFEVEVFC